jgi:hypothetical protein
LTPSPIAIDLQKRGPLARRSRFGQSPFVHYRLFISEKARQQLRVLEKSIRRNIGYRLELMRNDLAGRCEETGSQRQLAIWLNVDSAFRLCSAILSSERAALGTIFAMSELS